MTDGPRFDPTINLGHIITLTGVIVAVVGGWYTVDARLAAVEKQMTMLTTVVIDNARIDERVKAVERRIERTEIR